jgi:hypothetical protein
MEGVACTDCRLVVELRAGLAAWQVGWAVGPEPLITPLVRVHQYVTFCVTTPVQAAVATGASALLTFLPRSQIS